MRLPCLLYSRSRLRVHPPCLPLKKFFSLKLWNPRLHFGCCAICLFDCNLSLLKKNLQKLQRNHNFGMMMLYKQRPFTGCVASTQYYYFHIPTTHPGTNVSMLLLMTAFQFGCFALKLATLSCIACYCILIFFCHFLIYLLTAIIFIRGTVGNVI